VVNISKGFGKCLPGDYTNCLHVEIKNRQSTYVQRFHIIWIQTFGLLTIFEEFHCDAYHDQAMTAFKIPKHHVHAFLRLSKVSSDDFDGIMQHISDTNRQNAWTLSEVGALQLRLSKEQAVIFDAVLGLFTRWYFLDTIETKDIYDFVKIVKRNMAEFNIDAAELDEQNLNKRLAVIFHRCSYLRTSVKAIEIKSLGERVFEDVQIITDVRPVFMNFTEELNNNAAVITHKVLLTWIEEDNDRRIELMVTTDQLQELHEQITRAMSKEQQLRANGHFKYIDQ
jgi:hypothetical protein